MLWLVTFTCSADSLTSSDNGVRTAENIKPIVWKVRIVFSETQIVRFVISHKKAFVLAIHTLSVLMFIQQTFSWVLATGNLEYTDFSHHWAPTSSCFWSIVSSALHLNNNYARFFFRFLFRVSSISSPVFHNYFVNYYYLQRASSSVLI